MLPLEKITGFFPLNVHGSVIDHSVLMETSLYFHFLSIKSVLTIRLITIKVYVYELLHIQ